MRHKTKENVDVASWASWNRSIGRHDRSGVSAALSSHEMIESIRRGAFPQHVKSAQMRALSILSHHMTVSRVSQRIRDTACPVSSFGGKAFAYTRTRTLAKHSPATARDLDESFSAGDIPLIVADFKPPPTFLVNTSLFPNVPPNRINESEYKAGQGVAVVNSSTNRTMTAHTVLSGWVP